MAELAGRFYFITELTRSAAKNEGNMAAENAQCLNKLKDKNRNLTDLFWRPYEFENGTRGVSAQVSRIRTIHLVSDWLKDKGIAADFYIIENRPTEEEELAGQDRFWEIAINLEDIDVKRLKEMSDDVDVRMIRSLFFKEPHLN